MNRSVIIHRTGNTEVRDVNPALHQQLRGLAYRRFVLKFARAIDGVTMTSALYAHLPPSPWQVTSAAEQIWGRARGVTQVFDDEGHEVTEESIAAAAAAAMSTSASSMPAQSAAPAPATKPPAPAPSAPTPSATPGRLLVGAGETIILEPKAGTGNLPMIRLRPVPGRGWVVEASEWTIGSQESWTEIHIVPEILVD